MLNEQTITILNSLKLFGMARGISERLANPGHGELSHADFVGLLVQDEKTYRDTSGSSACSGKLNCGSRRRWRTSTTLTPGGSQSRSCWNWPTPSG